MGQDWIIGVLADLRSFAHKNDMPLLGEQLEEATLVASIELASLKDRAKLTLVSDGGEMPHIPPQIKQG